MTMENNLNELLEGDTGKIEFEGKLLTRKEIFDILVERASITEEEKQRREEEKKKAKERELKQAQFNAEDAVNSLLKNPKIPESVKKLLQE